eukprot:TRINITY_DN22161_c0_g1_i1.p1 TRINITY_DN22161_c0_g1~~TRINITY_DN22161_c0_g1_i1.p1  ORF type:complete len:148 (+),score=55.84 TRINITY_DN22161_c0_g1_i1:57-500(+)
MTDYSGKAVGAACRRARREQELEEDRGETAWDPEKEEAAVLESFRRTAPISGMTKRPKQEAPQQVAKKIIVEEPGRKRMSKAERKRAKKEYKKQKEGVAAVSQAQAKQEQPKKEMQPKPPVPVAATTAAKATKPKKKIKKKKAGQTA